ncbi:hypothetical protein CEW92_04890 [Bacillaceae bacterium SAS-127]|nr:hypothetical protein CEW92_04890 [Bacillaceae bacterium SAS-127]
MRNLFNSLEEIFLSFFVLWRKREEMRKRTSQWKFLIFFIIYPALTGCKTPISIRKKKRRRVGGRSTARKSPIGSGLHDAGYKGVATGRCDVSFCSSFYQWGMKKTPTD